MRGKIMKKALVFLVLSTLLLFAGCGGGSKDKQKDADETGIQDSDTPGEEFVDEDVTDSEPDDADEPEDDEDDDGEAAKPDNDSDSTEPEPVSKKTCPEIFSCYISCRSESCLQSCIKTGEEIEAEKFSGMYDCWLKKCGDNVLDNEFLTCVEENCKEKTVGCGLDMKAEDPSWRLPDPYGVVTVSLASSYIITADDTEVGKEALKLTDFARGYIGSTAVEPDYYSTYSFYSTDLAELENGKFLRTVQLHLDKDNNYSMNAMLLLPENVEKGKVKIGLDDNAVGKLIFGVFSTETGEIVCVDGFGAGELNIKAVKVANGAAGKLAVSGEINVYSPLDPPDDKTDYLEKAGVPLCTPKYPKFAGRLMYESTFASEDWEVDETVTIIDAEKYFAFEGSGKVGEGDIYVDLKELVGLGYSIGPSSSSGTGSSLSYFFKGTAVTAAHPEGEPAIALSVTGDEVLVGATFLLSDLQKAYMKPLRYAPEVTVYRIISCGSDSCDLCILAGNKVENGTRVGEFQSSYYSKMDFDSDALSSLTVAMSAELVEGEELKEFYPEENLCISME